MCCTYPKIISFYVLHVPQNHSLLCAASTPKSFLTMCCTYPKIIPFYVLQVPQNHSLLCAVRTPKSFLTMCCTYPKIIPYYVLHVPQNHSFLCAARTPKLFLSMCCTYPKIIPFYVLHVPQNHSFLCAALTPKSFLTMCCTYPKIIPYYVLHVPQNHSLQCAARTPKSSPSTCYAFSLFVQCLRSSSGFSHFSSSQFFHHVSHNALNLHTLASTRTIKASHSHKETDTFKFLRTCILMKQRNIPYFMSFLPCVFLRLILHLTNALNKIRFMTNIDLLPVSALGCRHVCLLGYEA
jgi:hypothetical protein